jgi:predicted dehydrogenase/threonine dehydrogenase-like Zn-dependent dehydrogenase
MRAILQNMRSGEIGVYDVPQPELRSGGILVRTAFSAISSGTEKASIEAAESSLLNRAMKRPDLVKQVLDYARVNGVQAAYRQVQTRLDNLGPLGYSCSGTVVAVGEEVGDFQIGDRVACGGVGYASHCEVNWVPRNLAVRLPPSVSLEAASLTTIAAIALQGVRQASIVLGETVIVIGAGLVGVLTMQLARAAGCRVIAIDSDPARVEKSLSWGAQLAFQTTDPELPNAVRNFSRYGADAAIIAASTQSADPLEQASTLLRDRGRIVVVGDVGMGVSRRSLYHKEISLKLSRSYGPGRYDPSYEEHGNDYPVGYVRWTERRNMEAVVDALAAGAIDVSRLVDARYLAREAGRAYEELLAGKGYTAILDYGTGEAGKAVALRPQIAAQKRSEKVAVGCIGAGGFAKSTIFPALRADKTISLEAVATASGVAAESARKNFGFKRAQTPDELLSDPAINAVFIASRHSSHAAYVVSTIQAGKAVFVEKPLAVDHAQLGLIQHAVQKSFDRGDSPFVMVGFNRRFAPTSQKIAKFFSGRREPMFIQARVNAGFIPREHWVQQAEEGGRIVGELCHFVDWARWLVGHPIRSVSAYALPDGARYNRDNVIAVLTFADGSIANLIYLANGDPKVAKERFEVMCEGAVAQLEDFEVLNLTRGMKTEHFKAAKDKGHRRQFELTLDAMKSGGQAPIPLHEIVEVTEATFSILKSISSGEPFAVAVNEGSADPMEMTVSSSAEASNGN